MGLGKVEEGKSSAAGNSLHPAVEDGIVAGRGFIFLTPSASPPLSSPLHPPPSTCSVSHLSLKTARGSHSLPPPLLHPLHQSPSPSLLQPLHHQQEKGQAELSSQAGSQYTASQLKDLMSLSASLDRNMRGKVVSSPCIL